MRRALALLSLSLSCSTLGSTGEGDVGLPSTGVGPFRKLTASEVRDVAPFVFDDMDAEYREPSVIALDPTDPTNPGVILYAVAAVTDAKGARDVLVRTHADDGRSFYGNGLDLGHKPPVVLSADQGWEGASLAGPSAIRIAGTTFLYYAAAGGVGLARSQDGFRFTKEPAPVLAPDPGVAWETSPPAAPSVAAYPDGRLRMLYAAGVSIGEAESADGLVWKRLDGDPSTPAMDPILGPRGPVGPLEDGARPPVDIAQVTDPCLLPVIEPTGQLLVRVLYTGFDQPVGAAARTSGVAFAARYGDRGPLVRQDLPVFANGKNEAAPALFAWSAGEMLYVHQETAGAPIYRSIAAGIAPVAVTLPPPLPYAASP